MVEKTYSPKASELSSTWRVIDAEGQVLGRLAAQIAGLLQGKHKPGYARHMLTGDFVIVVNAEKVAITGRKREQKVYYRHTGYMGHLKETPMWKMLETHPERVLQKAIKGMLPKSSLGSQMLRRLKIYPGPDHPHQAQVLGGERANLRTPQRPLAERRKKRPGRVKPPVEEAAVAAVVDPAESDAAAAASAEEETVSAIEEPTDEASTAEVEEQAVAEAPTTEVEEPAAEAPTTEAEEQAVAKAPTAEAEEPAVAEASQEPAAEEQTDAEVGPEGEDAAPAEAEGAETEEKKEA